MKKIIKLEIRNFKSHKHTIVEFGDFTAILGATNDGKSAMLAALKWALYNTPSGTGFIRHNMALCMVEVSFDDGSILTRLRSSEDAAEQQNKYTLTYPDGRQILLEHFGVGPTEQVLEFHGMYMLDLFGEKESINVCGQFDSPFFLSKSPQLKATLVGRLSGVSAYDLANKISDSDARSQKKEKKAKTKELKEIEVALKAFDTLDEDEKRLEHAKALEEKIEADIQKLSAIEKSFSTAKLCEEESLKCKRVLMYKDAILSANDKLTKLLSDVQNAKVIIPVNYNLSTYYQNLSLQLAFLSSFSKEIIQEYQNKAVGAGKQVSTWGDIKRTTLQIDEECKELQSAENVMECKDSVTQLFSDLSLTSSKCDTARKQQSALSDIVDFDASLTSTTKLISIRNDEKLDIKEQYAQKLKEAKVCPMCFENISEERAHEIADKLEE